MKFAPEFYVIEISPSVIEFIRNKVKIPELKAVFLVDSGRTGLEEDCFDLGILSHVLEHVAAPIELLQETLRISKYVILEVPLEDCLLLNLFSRFKEGISGIRRDDNPTGHIRFFSRLSVKNLIVSARGIILSEWNYFPSLEAAVYGRRGIKKLLSLFKHDLFTFVFKLTGSRIVDSHYAVLLKKRCN
jgi:SAM-dependent methyltransferase